MGLNFRRFCWGESRDSPIRNCDLLRFYEDIPSNLVDNRRPPKHIVAWFYSSRISFSTRMSIDKAIVKLREKGRIAKILDTFAGEEIPDGCTLRIDWILLALLHVIIIGVPLAGFLISMVCFSIGRRRRSRTGIDGNQTLEGGLSNYNYRGYLYHNEHDKKSWIFGLHDLENEHIKTYPRVAARDRSVETVFLFRLKNSAP